MLEIHGPLIEATLIKRTNRFTALVDLGGGQALAHVPTTSRMGELLFPGARVILSDRMRPDRVTRYDLIMVYHTSGLVSVDARVPNKLMEHEFREFMPMEFAGLEFERREVALGESRLDFLLTGPSGRCWVEVKSVTLVQDGVALFPDALTTRGARHLEELIHVRQNGDRASVVFVIQREDAGLFAPNSGTDPVFAETLRRAVESGVEAYAYRCRILPSRISIDRRVDVIV